MTYPMEKMVVIDGIRYKPADAARRGHKAVTPHAPISFDAPVVEDVEDEDETLPEPSKGGSKTDWAAYATAQGATADQLDGMSRDELAETYGA